MSDKEIIDKLEKYTEKNIPCDSCRYCAERPNVNYCIKELLNLYKELKQDYIDLDKECREEKELSEEHHKINGELQAKITKLEEENEMLKGMFKKSIKE